MKPNSSPRSSLLLRLALSVAAASLLGHSARAQNLFWDGNLDDTGGSGTWDTITLNWDDGSLGGTPTTWDNTDPSTATANFTNTSGAVTIETGTDINVNSMIFGVSGYSVAGTDGTSTLNFNGIAPTVEVTTSGQTATISAIIASGGFTKTGAGGLTLSGANTHAGGTTLDAGTMTFSNASALGTGTFTINGGTIGMPSSMTSLTLSTNNAMEWNGDFTSNPGSGASAILNLGSGTVTLNDNITVNVLSTPGTARTTVGGVIQDDSLLTPRTLTVTSVGTGQSGGNQLILSGANTYSGGTIVDSGALTINNNSALGTGSLTINGGAVFVPTGQTRTISNTVVLNSGWTSNSSGINAAGTLILTAPTLELNATRSITMHQGALRVSSVITDNGSNFGLNFNGGRFAPGTLRLSGANTFSGGLTVQTTGNRTILEINNAAALGTGTLTLTGGSAASGNNSIRINNLTGSALTLSTNNVQDWDTNFIFGMDLNGNGTGSSLNMGTGAVSLGSTSATTARTVNVHSNTLTVGGVISNGTTTNGLTKTGGATMVLTGANDYTGDTTVSAGTLTLGDTGEFRMVIQDANASNRLLGTSNLNLNGVLRLDISGLTDSTGTWNLVDVASLNESFGATFGLAFVGGPSFTDNMDGTYSSGGWTFETIDGNLTLVPEPSTFAMLLGGLGMLIGFRRVARRRA